jgi:hypothetical protein
VQNIETTFANHENEKTWETLTQRGKIAHICVLFKAYPGKRARKAAADRLQETFCLNREMIRKLGVGHKEQALGNYIHDYWEIFFCQ